MEFKYLSNVFVTFGVLIIAKTAAAKTYMDRRLQGYPAAGPIVASFVNRKDRIMEDTTVNRR